MENLGDWLYIILLIVAGVGSLLNSVKKKKQSQPAPGQATSIPKYEGEMPEEEPGSFWDIFDDTPKEQPRPQQEPKPIIQPRTHSRPLKAPVYTFEIDKSTEDPFISPESFHDTEELKKAIIYSEILNRKY